MTTGTHLAEGAGARLREMRWWDIEPVLALERALFPDDAWSRGMFWSELAHARGLGANRRYVVAEDFADGENSGTEEGSGTGAGRIVGYAGFAASGGLGDVQTIAVEQSQWGTGLGARLLTDLLRYATAFECSEVLLEVRVDNRRAQRLYERFGFEPIGFRRGYYQPGNVDALVMRLTMDAASPGPAGPAEPSGPAAPTGTSAAPDGTSGPSDAGPAGPPPHGSQGTLHG